MKSIREVLRLLLMGKRYSAYWRSRRAEDQRYHGIDPKPAKPTKGKRRG